GRKEGKFTLRVHNSCGTEILAGIMCQEPVGTQKSMHYSPGSTLIDDQAKSTWGHSAAVGGRMGGEHYGTRQGRNLYFGGGLVTGKWASRGLAVVRKRFHSQHLDSKRAEKGQISTK